MRGRPSGGGAPVRMLAVMLVLALGLTAAAWAAAPGAADAQAGAGGKVKVVVTFSILHDIVRNVGGHRVEIHSMVPIGQDPHEYTPTPLDMVRAADADLIFWNGLNMELGDGWFENLLAAAGRSLADPSVVALAEGVEPLYLTADRREINPHAYLDLLNAMQYVRNARDALMAVDPEHAAVYEANAAAYLAELEELHRRYVELLGSIPEERRILVTSERAFQYLAARYGLREGYVWAIDTDEQGTPLQILDLVRFVRTNNVPALFVESNKDPRAIETVSRETGVPIYAKVYSDELGVPDEGSGTFLGMMEWNLQVIYSGLTGR